MDLFKAIFAESSSENDSSDSEIDGKVNDDKNSNTNQLGKRKWQDLSVITNTILSSAKNHESKLEQSQIQKQPVSDNMSKTQTQTHQMNFQKHSISEHGRGHETRDEHFDRDRGYQPGSRMKLSKDEHHNRDREYDHGSKRKSIESRERGYHHGDKRRGSINEMNTERGDHHSDKRRGSINERNTERGDHHGDKRRGSINERNTERGDHHSDKRKGSIENERNTERGYQRENSKNDKRDFRRKEREDEEVEGVASEVATPAQSSIRITFGPTLPPGMPSSSLRGTERSPSLFLSVGISIAVYTVFQLEGLNSWKSVCLNFSG